MSGLVAGEERSRRDQHFKEGLCSLNQAVANKYINRSGPPPLSLKMVGNSRVSFPGGLPVPGRNGSDFLETTFVLLHMLDCLRVSQANVGKVARDLAGV